MSYRKERVRDVLLGFLAEEIRRLRDPRLELITVTDIEVSPDLKTARVYWTRTVAGRHVVPNGDAATDREIEWSLPNELEQREVEEALRGAEGLLKRRIGKELELRYVPRLLFRYDPSAAAGSRIDQLLGKVR